MDIVKLSNELTQEDFSDFLHYLKGINEKSKVEEWLPIWEGLLQEGVHPMEAMHFSYYDVMIDPQTGDWKSSSRPRITSSFDNLSY